MNKKYMMALVNTAVQLDISIKEAKKRVPFPGQKKKKKAKGRWWPGKYGGWRQSVEYYNWRQAVLERDNNICQKCKGTKGNMCGHHLDKDKDLRYDIDNGVCWCEYCHNAYHKSLFY